MNEIGRLPRAYSVLTACLQRAYSVLTACLQRAYSEVIANNKWSRITTRDPPASPPVIHGISITRQMAAYGSLASDTMGAPLVSH